MDSLICYSKKQCKKLLKNIFDIKEPKTNFSGFETDPRRSRFEIYGRTPELKINGKYSIDGRVFSFPVQGNGNLNCILKDVGIGIKFKPDTFTQNDKTFIKLNKLKMLVTTEKWV